MAERQAKLQQVMYHYTNQYTQFFLLSYSKRCAFEI